MKALYFDCFSGVSGDMILGALIEVGAPLEILLEGLKMMGLEGITVRKEEVRRSGLPGTKMRISASDKKGERNLKEILSIIERSSLPHQVKKDSTETFLLLGSVESRIHGVEMYEVHFHELGGIDSIVDVVGAMLFIHCLGVELVISSPLPSGRGFVNTSHGTLPVPAPASASLFQGIPVVFEESECELVTPTGVSILKKVVTRWGGSPVMKIAKVGYGAGECERRTVPNLLRVFLGEVETEEVKRTVWILETNVDDMNPQVCGHIVETLLEGGALDAFLTQVVMKKGRPGFLLTILSDDERKDALVETVFKETTTLGVRMRKEERAELERETALVETDYGKVRVKIARRPGGRVTVRPEFDDCLLAARKHGIGFLEVEENVKFKAMEFLFETGKP